MKSSSPYDLSSRKGPGFLRRKRKKAKNSPYDLSWRDSPGFIKKEKTS